MHSSPSLATVFLVALFIAIAVAAFICRPGYQVPQIPRERPSILWATPLIAIVICGFTAACSFKSERTVVQTPAPAQTIVATDAPPPGTTVYVPVRQ